MLAAASIFQGAPPIGRHSTAPLCRKGCCDDLYGIDEQLESSSVHSRHYLLIPEQHRRPTDVYVRNDRGNSLEACVCYMQQSFISAHLFYFVLSI
jgi:hypothetical protein